MLVLRDIMTRDVLTLQPSHSLREAMELFTDNHITGAPVVDRGAVTGVISMSDILDAASSSADAALAHTPDGWPGSRDDDDAADVLATYFTHGWADGDGDEGVDAWSEVVESQTVADVMTRTLAELPSTTELHAAAAYMLERGIHRVLVVDGGQLEGLVTTTDFLRLIAQRKL